MVFDVDGCLLDSAEGIVAGYQHALHSVEFPVPSEQVLRSDLGPPVGILFSSLGVPEEDHERAVAAYRRFYAETGLHQAKVYPDVLELLDELSARGVVLATATAKLTPVAEAILDRHGLAGHFAVVNGTDGTHHTKTETLNHTLERLGNPDRSGVLMLGDRHSDVAAAQACGVGSVAVTWGYGTLDELSATGADHLVDNPAEVLALLG
nr:HAD hydrolase-like protein [uncultured Friedmanniella sp.]